MSSGVCGTETIKNRFFRAQYFSRIVITKPLLLDLIENWVTVWDSPFSELKKSNLLLILCFLMTLRGLRFDVLI